MKSTHLNAGVLVVEGRHPLSNLAVRHLRQESMRAQFQPRFLLQLVVHVQVETEFRKLVLLPGDQDTQVAGTTRRGKAETTAAG